MKSKMLTITIAVGMSATVCWSVVRLSAQPEDAARMETGSGRSGGFDTKITAMLVEKNRIRTRLGITAPMELDTVNGIDPVVEATENGLVVEATLEEVEAALQAAAATPGTDDDKAAMQLRHRGSYRFYSEAR